MKKKYFLVAAIAAIILLLNFKYNIFEYFSINNIKEMKSYIDSFGIASPIIFITLYIIATVLFIPGLPITILAGILFGVFWGTIYVIIGSIIGVSIAFLIGRYLGRDFVKKMSEKNDKLAKLDSYIKKQGNTILIISRLIPLFPFNLQNYAYGITDIKFSTYFWYSLIFMIPGMLIYTGFGALLYSSIPLEKLIIYSTLLLIALCLLVILPRRIFKISKTKINNRND